MDGPQLERRAQERVAAGKGIKKEAENITEGNLNASENSMCTTSIPERSRADVSVSDRSHDKILDNDASVKTSNGFHDDCSGENSSSFPDSLDVNYLGSKANKIQQIVEDATSPESKEVVTKILDQVQQLSVAEKLLLYLRLPTGSSISVDPLTQPINPLGSRFEIQQTITWIKTHLEEDPGVSLPKQDVYDEYLGYCNNNAMKPLSTADFGKVMKQVFPRVRPRRLGTRGNSRYCYSGLRKRMKLDPPVLPDLGDLSRIGSHKPLLKGSGCIASGDEGHQDSPEHSREDMEVSTGEGERDEGRRDLVAAASHLVREWAEKLLGTHFSTLPELARHLVENMCVDGRSAASFTMLSEDQQPSRDPCVGASGPATEAGDRKCMSPRVPLLPSLNKTGGKHRETQVLLQRKLHGKEIIREQKRKIQDQQTAFRGGVALDHFKSQTGKKAKLGNNYSNNLKRSNSDESSTSANKICHMESVQVHSEVADRCWRTDSPTSVGSGKVLTDTITHKPLSKDQYINLCKDGNVSLGSGYSEKVELPGKPNGEMQRSKSAAIPSAPFDAIDPNSSMEDYKCSVSVPRSQSVLETVPLDGTACASSSLPQSGNSGKMLIPRLPPSSKVSTCKQMTNIIIIPPVAGCSAAPASSVTPKSRKKYKPIQPKQSPDGSRGKGTAAGNGRRMSRTLGLQSPSILNDELPGKDVRNKKLKSSMSDVDVMVDKIAGVTADVATEDNALLVDIPTSDGIGTIHSSTTMLTASLSRDAGLVSTSVCRGSEMMSIPCLEKDALDDYLHGSNSQEEEFLKIFQNNTGEGEQKDVVGGGSSEISCAMPCTAAEDSNSMGGSKTKQLSQLRLLLERNFATSSSNVSTLSRTSSTEYSSAPSSSDFSASSLPGRSESAGGRTKPALPSLSSFGTGGFSGFGTRRRVSFETPVHELQTTTQLTSVPSCNAGMQASVPPSPNTRRQIFSFTPISPGHDSPGTVSFAPNVPTSVTSGNNASPFVSPRGTPIPRSRHDSGQTSVVPTMPTPFISPQATPTPFGRSRHSSSGGMQAGRGILNGSSQAHSQHLALRPRHSSGTNVQRHCGSQFSPGGIPLNPIECSTDSNLPPPTSQQFVAPSETGVSSRVSHCSASGITPVSPGSAPHSPVVQSCSTQHAGSFLDSEPVAQTQGLLQAALQPRPGNSHYQYRVPNAFGSSAGGHSGDHQRQRHVSAGTALSTVRVQSSQGVSGQRDLDSLGNLCSPSGLQNLFSDPLGQEVSNLLSDTANLDSSIGGPLGPPPLYRSQSVPLHRMVAVDALGLSSSSDLPYLNSILSGEGFGNSSTMEGICPSRSHPTTPLGLGQRFGFNMESAASSVAPTPVPSEFADFGCLDTGGASNVLEGMGVTGGEDSMDNRAGDVVATPLEGTDDSHLNAFLDDVVFLEGQSSMGAARQFSSRSYPNTPVPDANVAAVLGDTGISVEDVNSRRNYGDAMLASRSFPSTPLISTSSLPLLEPTLNALNANSSGPAGGFSAQRNTPDFLDQSQVESLEAYLECQSEFSQLAQEVDAIPEG